MEQTHQPSQGFGELGISADILAILAERNLTEPTPIQHQAIPPAMQGKDVIGIAQTGTGKTFAFGIPMLERLRNGKGRGLVVVPTRELAHQVEESLRTFATKLGIRAVVIIGGASMYKQKEMIRSNPRIVIATPGRLNDHLEQGTITLREVEVLVLDEADRMLDMGFKPQIDRILKHVTSDHQTMLFSATMPQEIVRLATAHMKLPLTIEVARAGTTAENVEQELFIVKREDKTRLLLTILKEYSGRILVFSRTKHGATKITRQLRTEGHSAAEIHANRSLRQRQEALEGFKKGTFRVLVATDIAARGIHVTGIEVVVNFDLPDDPADYVHRIGRTARAGKAGRAISFATPDQAKGIRDIERLTRAPLKRKQHTMVPGTQPNPAVQPAQSLPRYRPNQQPNQENRGNRGFRRRR